ncbi:hypothetical protein GZ998_07130 [Actinomyces sp. 594]|uniref:hypothetical protein n=1 Tax=Actinomyces sp. 594 TaxID=2057793 RepID=UPI001C580ACE|nr:hypothetical protein [Actinomyces sp. 594]MBW3069275.1 hypothetical protein [Actinomyces sp. 594]
MITFRKTKAGKWVAYGPYTELKDSEGGEIEVTLKSGKTTTRKCVGLGKPFMAKGCQMVYAYLDDRGNHGGSRSKGGRRCEECGSTRGVHLAYDLSGIPGYACYRCDDGTLSFA